MKNKLALLSLIVSSFINASSVKSQLLDLRKKLAEYAKGELEDLELIEKLDSRLALLEARLSKRILPLAARPLSKQTTPSTTPKRRIARRGRTKVAHNSAKQHIPKRRKGAVASVKIQEEAIDPMLLAQLEEEIMIQEYIPEIPKNVSQPKKKTNKKAHARRKRKAAVQPSKKLHSAAPKKRVNPRRRRTKVAQGNSKNNNYSLEFQEETIDPMLLAQLEEEIMIQEYIPETPKNVSQPKKKTNKKAHARRKRKAAAQPSKKLRSAAPKKRVNPRRRRTKVAHRNSKNNNYSLEFQEETIDPMLLAQLEEEIMIQEYIPEIPKNVSQPKKKTNKKAHARRKRKAAVQPSKKLSSTAPKKRVNPRRGLTNVTHLTNESDNIPKKAPKRRLGLTQVAPATINNDMPKKSTHPRRSRTKISPPKKRKISCPGHHSCSGHHKRPTIQTQASAQEKATHLNTLLTDLRSYVENNIPLLIAYAPRPQPVPTWKKTRSRRPAHGTSRKRASRRTNKTTRVPRSRKWTNRQSKT